jgi:uncharacterized protein (TIGR01777 family)
MKILVTGATGLVGSALSRALTLKNHTVCRLIRPGSAPSPQKSTASSQAQAHGFDVPWNPLTGDLGGAAVGADAVVNLAGAPIAGGRWTPERKALLRSSRIDTTRALVTALGKMGQRPSVLVSASAIGFYGDRGDDVLTEDSAGRSDFLSELAQHWENEALKAESMGIRVVLARFGIILSRDGGALPQMMMPFWLYFGGKIGSGRQWMSWISLHDVVEILQLAIEQPGMQGPVNFVSPNPVRNVEFTKILAAAMHRPAIVGAPQFALRVILGEMADALLASQRGVPAKLQEIGYQFVHRDLLTTLSAILKTT